MLGIEADEERIQQLRLRFHRAYGMACGVLAALIVGAGMRPMRAGILTGDAAFVLVDEAPNAVQLEPSPFDFPIEAHIRGVIGHATLGVALGTALTIAKPLLARR